MISAIIGIIGTFVVVFFIGNLLSKVGEGFVVIFEKTGLGKTGSLILGGIVFLVFIELLKYIIYG